MLASRRLKIECLGVVISLQPRVELLLAHPDAITNGLSQYAPTHDPWFAVVLGSNFQTFHSHAVAANIRQLGA